MFLHVSNGHAATGVIELSGVPGRTQVWCDPLNEGPVPGGISDEELLLVRARFLAANPGEVDDVAADLLQWRRAIDDDDSYQELVLWFEHDLFDQLNLIQLLTHLGGRARPKPVSLVCIDRHPGYPNFKGLGELEPRDVRAMFPLRRHVTTAQYALAKQAWAAYRSPDPRALEDVLALDTSALPFLGAALARHLEEFPSERDGLSRTERRLLEQASDGPAQIHEAFARMHDGERAYYIADAWFFDRARDLAQASPPLMQLTITSDRNTAMPAGTIALTPEGRDVLRGDADRVKLCGIDRWLGGVHVHGGGPGWRWSDRAGHLLEV